ncbi:hypothetical protein NFI96_021221 [Prochilodus magdalenae]|nr:hypothetical protein NFI96_021221 [Prochilodus magdalenae]
MSTNDRSTAGRQLLFIDQRSASRLLEVYVKRSLSLNDAGGLRKQRLKSRKWVTLNVAGGQARRASSDSSTHRLSIEKILKPTEPLQPPQSDGTLQSSRLGGGDVEKKTRKTPERARKSFLRVVSHWFSKKGSETKPEPPRPETCSLDVKAEEVSKVVKKKHSFRKLSFRSVEKSESLRKTSALTPEDVVRLPHAVSVEPTSTYFEKVSEELERIVKEVKTKPDGGADGGLHAAALEEQSAAPDDAVERIISLLKQHGDAMDVKIQKNTKIHSFFQRLTYNSFQQLADCYLSQIPQPVNRVPHTAPELVQLAFTLDFTAKLAGLSSQAVSRIMGFGNQYLQDRFTQICSAHKQFGDGPFLFQHDRTPVHRASSIKTWMSESGVEELDWPAQSPDLHLIEHLWDGLEWRLRARPSCPTSVSDLTNVLLEECPSVGTGGCPTGRCPQDAAPQDAAHRTLPIGLCPQDTAPQDAAHRTLPIGPCP